MSNEEQYTNAVRQTQEAWAGVVESLTNNVQAFTTNTNPIPTVDPSAAIDQIFDFWSKTLEAQREALKQIAGASVAAGERVREQVGQVGSAVREQGETVKGAVREQAESTERVAREQAEAVDRAEREEAKAAKRAERDQARAEREQVLSTFENLTKAELQEELANRDLPKSGKVDELRERLVADELK